MSSPSRKTRSSFSISSHMPWRIASRYVITATSILRENSPGECRRIGWRHFLGPRLRLVELPLDALFELLDLRARHHPALDHQLLVTIDRVFLFPLLEHAGRDVLARVVMLGVPETSEGLRLDERRAAPRAGPIDSPSRGGIHRQHVVAVDHLAVNPVGFCLVG